jgi:3-isopropylmalate/(R)-2-methylmalate dehydratase small subunit
MEQFIRHKGIVAPLDRVNVDTDAIIPKQFLQRVDRSGFGQFLFYDWRYQIDGGLNPEFTLNQPQFAGGSILLSRNNFGCGSSREHAQWALADFGFRVILAPSFADIFYNNCFRNGLLPIMLPEEVIDELFQKSQQEGFALTVDLEQQVIQDAGELEVSFEVDPYRRALLMDGLDDIGVTQKYAEQIDMYEQTGKAVYQQVFQK